MPPRLSNPPSVEGNPLDNYVRGGFLSIPNLIGSAINNFINSLLSLLPFGIGNGLNGLAASFNQTHNIATGAASSVVEVRKEVVQKLTVFDVKSPTPLWTAINGTEYPSIPLSDAFRLQVATSTSTGTHNHSVKGSGTSTASASVQLNIPINRLNEESFTGSKQWFAFIRIPIDTALSGINFYARGVPSDLRTKVYLMQPTGDMDQLTPESSNLAGLLVSNSYTATPTTFEDVIVEAGAIVAVRFSVVGTVYLLGDQMSYIEPPSGFYPKHLSCSTALPSDTVAPASVAESSVVWSGSFVPYVAIGNNIVVAQDKRNFEDNFDRADTNASGGVGANWSVNSFNIGIRTNAVAYTSGSDGSAVAMYKSPLTTDRIAVSFHHGNPEPGQGAPNALSRVLFRARSDKSSGLALSFRKGLVTLDEVTSGNTYTRVLAPPVQPVLVDGGRFDITCGELVDGVENPEMVTVWYNDVQILRTEVPFSVVEYGPARRYLGLFVQRTPFQSSIRINDWYAYDVPDPELPSVDNGLAA